MASFQDTVELPVIFKCFSISILNLQKNFYINFLQKVEKNIKIVENIMKKLYNPSNRLNYKKGEDYDR